MSELVSPPTLPFSCSQGWLTSNPHYQSQLYPTAQGDKKQSWLSYTRARGFVHLQRTHPGPVLLCCPGAGPALLSATAGERQGHLPCSHDSMPSLPPATGGGRGERRISLPSYCYCSEDKWAGRLGEGSNLAFRCPREQPRPGMSVWPLAFGGDRPLLLQGHGTQICTLFPTSTRPPSFPWQHTGITP